MPRCKQRLPHSRLSLSCYLSALTVEDASIAYSWCGLPIAQNIGISAAFDEPEKDRWTLKSNRLAVFADSVQYTDKVNVVSRGTPRSQALVICGA